MLLTHSDQDHINGLVFAVRAERLRRKDPAHHSKLPILERFFVAAPETVDQEVLRTWIQAFALAKDLPSNSSYLNGDCLKVDAGHGFDVSMIRILPTETPYHRRKSLAAYLRH